MPMRALIVTTDDAVLGVFGPPLQEVRVEVQRCGDATSARQHLDATNYDVVVLDCDDLENGCQLLDDLRRSEANKNTIVIAVLNGATTVMHAFDVGANFVLKKPPKPEDVHRHLEQALRLMKRERRRYFRYACFMPVLLTCGELLDHQAQAVNLSEGGMSVRTGGTKLEAEHVHVMFTIPGDVDPIRVQGRVAWQDATGKAGIRFVGIGESELKRLQQWAARQPISIGGG